MSESLVDPAQDIDPGMGDVVEAAALLVARGRMLGRLDRGLVDGGAQCRAARLLCLRSLELDSSYLVFAWPLLVMSTGIGSSTAPATSAIMGAVPDEKQGWRPR